MIFRRKPTLSDEDRRVLEQLIRTFESVIVPRRGAGGR